MNHTDINLRPYGYLLSTMKGHCSGNCKAKDFQYQILYNNAIYTHWSNSASKYVSTLNAAKRTRRYTSKHKALGLAKCKVCEYITAKPTRPGLKCPCCNQSYSQSIRDIRKGASDEHRKRLEHNTKTKQ